MKNPWGDPLLVHQPTSAMAVAAFLAAFFALCCAALTLLWPTEGQGQAVYALAIVLLVFLQAAGTAASFTLAYLAFRTCPLSNSRPGRGLAWAALAVSYASALWILFILAGIWPIFGWAAAVVAVVGLLHIPAFAAESSFGKQMVTAVVIGGTCFSLLSCALQHSRESARRRQCENNLRQIGMNLVFASELQIEQHSSPRAENDELARLLQQVLDEAQQSGDVGGTLGE